MKALGGYDYLISLNISLTHTFATHIFIVEQNITTVLLKDKLTAAQRTHLTKIQHKLRSIIAFVLRSGCLSYPEIDPEEWGKKRWEELKEQEKKSKLQVWGHYKTIVSKDNSAGSWRDVFDMNSYLDILYPYRHSVPAPKKFDFSKAKIILSKKKKEDDDYIFKIDTNHSCAFLVKMMKELTLDQIEHEQSNEKFFMEMMRLSAKDVSHYYKLDLSNTYAGHVQNFFKQAFLPQVITNTEKSMGDMLKRFPFHRENLVSVCEARKKAKFSAKVDLLAEIKSVNKIRASINCDNLNNLPTTIAEELTPTNSVLPLIFHKTAPPDNTIEIKLSDDAPKLAALANTNVSFPNTAILVDQINFVTNALNNRRAALHAIVRKHTVLTETELENLS